MPDFRGDWDNGEYASLNLVVDVPKTLAFDVEDRSGDLEISRVGGDFVVASKETGSIEHRDVRGRVEVPERERRRRRY